VRDGDTLQFGIGAVPLSLSTGAGAEARAAIGWVIIGGASLSTLMTLFLVPVLFRLAGQYSQPRSTIGEKIDALMASFGHAKEDHAGGKQGEGPNKPAPTPAE